MFYAGELEVPPLGAAELRMIEPMRLSFRTGLVVLIAGASLALSAQSSSTSSTRGPARGSLVLQGGVGPNPVIDGAFRALAGGPGSHIVLIPTASLPDTMPPEMMPDVMVFLARRFKERFGVSAVTVLHDHDRSIRYGQLR